MWGGSYHVAAAAVMTNVGNRCRRNVDRVMMAMPVLGNAWSRIIYFQIWLPHDYVGINACS